MDEKELNAAFETLDLINCTDIDAFLKVLLLVDEKTSQNIRGELNHMMLKHIESDTDLKHKLIKNNYIDLNYARFTSMTKKIKDGQIDHYRSNIKKVIIEEIDQIGFINVIRNINEWFAYNRWLRHKYEDNPPLKIINTNLIKIFELLVDDSQLYNIWIDEDTGVNLSGDILKSFTLDFNGKNTNRVTANKISINFDITEVNECDIGDICEYFGLQHCETPTLEYYKLGA
jgi:hypothetical protein